MLTKKQIASLLSTGKVDEVENEGCEEGRFFVHLKNEWDFDIDPLNNRRSDTFGGYMEAKKAVKAAIKASTNKKDY